MLCSVWFGYGHTNILVGVLHFNVSMSGRLVSDFSTEEYRQQGQEADSNILSYQLEIHIIYLAVHL